MMLLALRQQKWWFLQCDIPYVDYCFFKVGFSASRAVRYACIILHQAIVRLYSLDRLENANDLEGALRPLVTLKEHSGCWLIMSYSLFFSHRPSSRVPDPHLKAIHGAQAHLGYNTANLP